MKAFCCICLISRRLHVVYVLSSVCTKKPPTSKQKQRSDLNHSSTPPCFVAFTQYTKQRATATSTDWILCQHLSPISKYNNNTGRSALEKKTQLQKCNRPRNTADPQNTLSCKRKNKTHTYDLLDIFPWGDRRPVKPQNTYFEYLVGASSRSSSSLPLTRLVLLPCRTTTISTHTWKLSTFRL